MVKLKLIGMIFFGGVFLVILMMNASAVTAGDDSVSRRIPEGVYIELTKEFYEALGGNGDRGSKIYSNDPSVQYLKEIAISTRFMVETNLQILKYQEKMIQLLDGLKRKKK